MLDYCVHTQLIHVMYTIRVGHPKAVRLNLQCVLAYHTMRAFGHSSRYQAKPTVYGRLNTCRDNLYAALKEYVLAAKLKWLCECTLQRGEWAIFIIPFLTLMRDKLHKDLNATPYRSRLLDGSIPVESPKSQRQSRNCPSRGSGHRYRG